jgi:hypothetical protein
MAKPIKPTPILTDKEAADFIVEMDKSSDKRVPVEEVMRGKRIYEAVIRTVKDREPALK